MTGNVPADVFTAAIYGVTTLAGVVVLAIWAVRGIRRGWRRLRAARTAKPVTRRAVAARR